MQLNTLKHSVSGVNTHAQNSQLLKYIPEIVYDFFTFIFCLQIALTVLGIGLFLNTGRISAYKNYNFPVPQRVNRLPSRDKTSFFFLSNSIASRDFPALYIRSTFPFDVSALCLQLLTAFLFARFKIFQSEEVLSYWWNTCFVVFRNFASFNDFIINILSKLRVLLLLLSIMYIRRKYWIHENF